MKMFKRLLALVIAFSIFAVLPAVAETETKNTVETAQYEKLVEKLSAVGLWSIEKNANDLINRAEFASLMAKLVAADDSAIDAIDFIDVDKNSEYYNAIAYMKTYGIMNGIDAQRFAPLRTITYNEALKTVLSTLGYGDRAEVKGGYPNGYVSIGLDVGFKVGTGELTALEAAKMLEQAAFRVRIMTVIGYQKEGPFSILAPEGDKTVLMQYHNIFPGVGKLTDNGLTRLYSKSEFSPKEELVSIDNEAFKYYGSLSIRRALNSTIDYYYKNDAGAKTLLWWEYTYQNREELVVYAENIAGDHPDFNKLQLVYYENDRLQKAQIHTRAAYIYNEVALPGFTKEDLKAQEGWFTLVDDDGDGVYDMIFAEVYENYFVTSISNNGEIISDRFNRGIDTGKASVVEVFSSEGEDISTDPSAKIDPSKEIYLSDRSAGSIADAVALNNVISVFKSDHNGKNVDDYIKIILSAATVTDNLNKTSKDEEKLICTVGSKDYEINDYLLSKLGLGNNPADKDPSLTELKIGEKYRFYLDYRGQIAYFDAMTALNQYVYVLAAGLDGGHITKTVKMRGLLETGEIATLPFAKKVVHNDVEKTAEQVLSDTSISSTNQLVRIRVNGKGEIRELSTSTAVPTSASPAPRIKESGEFLEAVGYDPVRFTMVENTADAYYYTNGRHMFGKYAIAPTSKLFYVPASGVEEDYRVYDGSQASDRLKTRYKLKSYDADNVHTAKAFVYSEKDGGVDTPYYNYAYIVLGVKNTTNHTGDIVKQIRVWCYDFEFNLIENAPNALPADVKEGDILRLYLNDEERIVKSMRILETKGSSRPTPFAKKKSDNTLYEDGKESTGESILYGYPVGRNNQGITVSLGSGAKEGQVVKFIPFYTPGIVYFDVENMDCSTAARNSIPVMGTLNTDTKKFDITNKDVAVLITTASSGMYDCIIIQY